MLAPVDPLKFRVAKSIAEIAVALGVKYRSLYFVGYGRGRQYKSFSIRKKSGGRRLIEEPFGPLKGVQRRLAAILNAVYKPRKAAHGFIPERSIVSNAKRHRGRRWVLNIDLHDFFPSITFYRVRGMLMGKPLYFSKSLAGFVAALCTTREGNLPQGAPSSPVLSNMLCVRLDRQLSDLCARFDIRYTRYADDLTFSTDAPGGFPAALATCVRRTHRKPAATLGDELRGIIASNGFAVNEEKIRIFAPRARKEVTGLTVNREAINVRRDFVRELRVMIDHWRKDPAAARAEFLDAHDKKRHRKPGPDILPQVIQGKLAFLSMVKGTQDPVYCRLNNQWVIATGQGTLREVVVSSRQHWERAVWRLFGQNGQGTAFAISGYTNHLLTSFHNIGNIDSGLWHGHEEFTLRSWAWPELCLTAHVAWACPRRDLAILWATKRLPEHLRLAAEAPRQRQEVWLCGYPEYAEDLRRCVKTRTHVRDVYSVPLPHFVAKPDTLSAPPLTIATVEHGIVEGMSGGPVITNDGRVVGVMYKGLTKKQLQLDSVPTSIESHFVLPTELPVI